MAKRKNTKSTGAAQPSAKPSKAKTGKAADVVYQLKITLKDVKPPIWRRVLVLDCSLAELHDVIQVAMGWGNCHLYEFEAGGVHYGDAEIMDDLEMEDADEVRLSQVAPEAKAKLFYTYDFGDDWRHDVLVEKILPIEEGRAYPACIDGKRAGPPDDVGGAWGYMEFAVAIRDPAHEQYEEFMEWAGEFDPEAFDLEAVNKELGRLG